MSINTIALISLPGVDLHTQTYKYFHRIYIIIMDISRNEAVHSQYNILRIYIASEEQYLLSI